MRITNIRDVQDLADTHSTSDILELVKREPRLWVTQAIMFEVNGECCVHPDLILGDGFNGNVDSFLEEIIFYLSPKNASCLIPKDPHLYNAMLNDIRYDDYVNFAAYSGQLGAALACFLDSANSAYYCDSGDALIEIDKYKGMHFNDPKLTRLFEDYRVSPAFFNFSPTLEFMLDYHDRVGARFNLQENKVELVLAATEARPVVNPVIARTRLMQIAKSVTMSIVVSTALAIASLGGKKPANLKVPDIRSGIAQVEIVNNIDGQLKDISPGWRAESKRGEVDIIIDNSEIKMFKNGDVQVDYRDSSLSKEDLETFASTIAANLNKGV